MMVTAQIRGETVMEDLPGREADPGLSTRQDDRRAAAPEGPFGGPRDDVRSAADTPPLPSAILHGAPACPGRACEARPFPGAALRGRSPSRARPLAGAALRGRG